jgi:hypothetical protein
MVGLTYLRPKLGTGFPPHQSIAVGSRSKETRLIKSSAMADTSIALDALLAASEDLWVVDPAKPIVCPLLKREGRLPKYDDKTFYAGVEVGVKDKRLARQWRIHPNTTFKNVLARVRIEGWPIFMDADRSAVAEAFTTLLWALDTGQLVGNCHSRLAIGPAGTGKSTFLQALVVTAQQLCQHTIAVWADAAAVTDITSDARCADPVSLIVDAVKLMWPTSSTPPAQLDEVAVDGDVARLLLALQCLGLRVVLVIDEYAAIFSRPAAVAERWTQQVYALGNATGNGSLHHLLILGGSVPSMRSMCFGPLPLSLANYPFSSSSPGNLHSQRFTTWQLGPIGIEDMPAFLDRWKCPAGEKGNQAKHPKELLKTGGDMLAFYASTGGIHRAVHHELVSLAHHTDPQSAAQLQLEALDDAQDAVGRHAERVGQEGTARSIGAAAAAAPSLPVTGTTHS